MDSNGKVTDDPNKSRRRVLFKIKSNQILILFKSLFK